nr:hypothetical protein [Sphingomonas sp. Y57]
MSRMESIGTASARVADRVMMALVSGLEIEFGRHAGRALAERFLDAEEVDFHWDARGRERWLGTYDGSFEDEDLELDRVVIEGRLDDQWFVATMIVDGDGHAHGMLGKRTFSTRKAADEAYGSAH